MPKKKKDYDLKDRLESFNADLISLFNKHRICLFFEFKNLYTIDDGIYVDSLVRSEINGTEMVVPSLSQTNWDELINLEGDLP